MRTEVKVMRAAAGYSDKLRLPNNYTVNAYRHRHAFARAAVDSLQTQQKGLLGLDSLRESQRLASRLLRMSSTPCVQAAHRRQASD